MPRRWGFGICGCCGDEGKRVLLQRSQRAQMGNHSEGESLRGRRGGGFQSGFLGRLCGVTSAPTGPGGVATGGARALAGATRGSAAVDAGRTGRGGGFRRPCRGGARFYHRFHGLRCAPPVATARNPFGVGDDTACKFNEVECAVDQTWYLLRVPSPTFANLRDLHEHLESGGFEDTNPTPAPPLGGWVAHCWWLAS